MPPQSHKSEYTILALLGVVTAVALLWMAWAGMLREQRAGAPGVRTTRSTNEDGTLIGYTLFERLGLPVERSNRMLISDQLEGVGTVFLIDPLVPVGAAEIEDLSAWVARGGALVTTEILPNLSPALRQRAKDSPPARGGVPSRGRPGHRRGEGHFSEVPSEAKALPLARDVSAVLLETEAAFRTDPPDPNGAPDVMEQLFTDNHGVRIAQWRVGRGCVVLLSDSSFLANANIAEGDNAVLAANLVGYAQAQAGNPRVMFNEFHFGTGGFGRGMGVLALLLLTTSPGWAVLALTAAGILFLFYKGRQFGPRRGFGQQRRRSKLEYVRAVGATYRAAGAQRLTLRLIYTWFRQQVMNRTGLTAGASNQLVAQELARRGRSPAAEYQRVLDGCDRILSQPTISQRQLTAAVGQLARIEKEILHGSGNGKQPGR
jgi:hypothetical protein